MIKTRVGSFEGAIGDVAGDINKFIELKESNPLQEGVFSIKDVKLIPSVVKEGWVVGVFIYTTIDD